MKKLVSVVVVLVLVLVVAPWGIGKLAESRVTQGLDKLVEVAPYLKVVESKYTAGWFRSEQDVTFELFGDLARALEHPPVAAANASHEGFIHTAAEVVADPEEEAAASNETPPPVAAPPTPLRIVVHNEILHGPVLWLSGFGIANVKSNIVWPAEVQKELLKIFGDDQPFKVSTRIGFFGGGTTTFAMDKRIIRPEPGSEVSWDDFRASISYSGDADRYKLDGKWPRFEVQDADGTHVLMTDLSMDADATRIVGDLYDTDGQFALDSLDIVGKDKESVAVKDVLYRFDTDKHGDFVDMAFKFGTGSIIAREFTLKEAHYDFSLRHLHAETLEKLLAEMKKVYTQPMVTPADIAAAVVSPYKEQGVALMKYDPEIAVDRIMVATPEGDGTVKGLIKFKGLTAEDFENGAMSLIPKIVAEFDVDVSEDMLVKLSGSATAAGAAIDMGYAKRKDGHLISHIEFKDGALTINGKPQGIPGLGGPPPPPERQE